MTLCRRRSFSSADTETLGFCAEFLIGAVRKSAVDPCRFPSAPRMTLRRRRSFSSADTEALRFCAGHLIGVAWKSAVDPRASQREPSTTYRSAWVFCGILNWRCLEVSSRSKSLQREPSTTYRSALVFCGILNWRLLGSQQSVHADSRPLQG